ncbi:MAG: hypothetical protein DRI61_11360, partial [Chloroflexi bacterium]
MVDGEFKKLTDEELKGYLAGYLLTDGTRYKFQFLNRQREKPYLANSYGVGGIQKDKDLAERISYILN